MPLSLGLSPSLAASVEFVSLPADTRSRLFQSSTVNVSPFSDFLKADPYACSVLFNNPNQVVGSFLTITFPPVDDSPVGVKPSLISDGSVGSADFPSPPHSVIGSVGSMVGIHKTLPAPAGIP